MLSLLPTLLMPYIYCLCPSYIACAKVMFVPCRHCLCPAYTLLFLSCLHTLFMSCVHSVAYALLTPVITCLHCLCHVCTLLLMSYLHSLCPANTIHAISMFCLCTSYIDYALPIMPMPYLYYLSPIYTLPKLTVLCLSFICPDCTVCGISTFSVSCLSPLHSLTVPCLHCRCPVTLPVPCHAAVCPTYSSYPLLTLSMPGLEYCAYIYIAYVLF